MSMTDIEIKEWVENYVNTNPGYSWEDWNGHTFGRGLHHKYDVQLYSLQDMYTEKLKRLYRFYKEIREGLQSGVSDSFIQTTSEDEIKNLKDIKDKGWRIADKFRTLNAEIAGREAGQFGPGLNFDREYRGTEYYIDLGNGSDASPHTGLKYGNFTMESGSGEFILVEDNGLDSRVTNGDWTPCYVYNVTRGAGALVTNSVYSTGTWTLTHGSISGQVSGDTYYILDAWLTFAQYTSVTSRSPADTAYVRANTSEVVGAAINCDDDGNANGLISIIGCDSVINDPWGDGSDVKPIVDFDSGNYYISMAGDSFWFFKRFELKDSTSRGFNYSGNYFCKVVACYIHDCYRGIYGSFGGMLTVEDCTLLDNQMQHFFGEYGGDIYFKNTSMHAGVGVGTSDAIHVRYRSGAVLENCDLGSDPFGDDAFEVYNGGYIYLINTAYEDTYGWGWGGVLRSEDHKQVKDDTYYNGFGGTVERETTIVRPSGADSSMKMLSNAICGIEAPCFISTLNHQVVGVLPEAPFQLWLEGGVERTVTAYIRTCGTWSTYPTADELYLEASYLDHAVDATRTKVQSNDVLSHVSDWKAFDVTFTPQQEGLVYLNVFLKKYEDAGDGCYVDILPIIS